MKIAIIQNDIVWGNPAANREHVAEILADCEQVDLLVLPEYQRRGIGGRLLHPARGCGRAGRQSYPAPNERVGGTV